MIKTKRKLLISFKGKYQVSIVILVYITYLIYGFKAYEKSGIFKLHNAMLTKDFKENTLFSGVFSSKNLTSKFK